MMSYIHPSMAAIGHPLEHLVIRHAGDTFRRIMGGPAVTLDPRFVRLATGESHPFSNFACMADHPDAEGVRTAISPFMQSGAPSAMIFNAPVAGDVATELATNGFVPHGGLTAMAVNIEELRTTTLPAGYVFARANSPQQREAWATAFAHGYGLPPRTGPAFDGGLGAETADDASMQYFWILKDGTPVCTSVCVLGDGVAGIYAVATLPEARGQGLGAFATAEPLRIAHRQGYRVGVLQASDQGHPVYRRIGFVDVGAVPLYLRMPA